MLGRTLSHHKVLEVINIGGMEIVYKVLDLELNQEVALHLRLIPVSQTARFPCEEASKWPSPPARA